MDVTTMQVGSLRVPVAIDHGPHIDAACDGECS
jgi:hypothetical protein